MAHLLVVDDEQSICWGLSKLGRTMGHTVAVAASAEETAEETAEEEVPAGPAGELTIWDGWAGDYEANIYSVFDAYLEMNPNVTIEGVEVEDFQNKLATAVPAGEGPDIVCWVHDKIGEWAEIEVLARQLESQGPLGGRMSNVIRLRQRDPEEIKRLLEQMIEEKKSGSSRRGGGRR